MALTSEGPFDPPAIYNDEADVENPVRHDEFWFDDGSIILQCPTTMFRVHRSVLSLHSQVFRDMLTVGEPGAGDSIVEGCPVIPLSDHPYDVANLLGTLYYRRHIAEMTDFKQILSILRISSKYMFDALRHDAVAHLCRCYPADLQTFHTASAPAALLAPSYAHMFYAVHAGLAYDIPAILPAAYYHICQLPVDAIAAGITMPDGRALSLPPEAVATCLAGRKTLGQWEHDAARALARRRDARQAGQADSIDDKHVCQHLGAYHSFVNSKRRAYDLFSCQWIDEVLSFHPMCVACEARAKDGGVAVLRVYWKKLPQCFGLESWKSVMQSTLRTT